MSKGKGTADVIHAGGLRRYGWPQLAGGSSSWRTVGILRGLALPVLIVLVWQAGCTLLQVSPTVLPAPLQILQTLQDLLQSGELINHLAVSVTRALTGFLLGAGPGLLLGMLIGLSRRTEQFMDPTLQMLRTVPHLALAPLFILWFGLGELSKVLLIALGAFFPLYVNTFLGIRGVDQKLFDVARILEFSRRKQATKLILPAALPNILLGIRLSLGAAWLGLVVSELMGASEGIGYLIMDARQFSRTEVVFIGILIFAIGGKAADSFVRILESRLLRWRDSYQGKER
ncbi:ABC transporter permease [Ectobacillus ponti]|uniref:ABC transporter permease n=1 Tax=Ectobacillus ponti TaxID=2961894 RepID=A0AA41X6F7_9BACI|nr:ABC transporter permease [Ectobacillus ponti]MCP8967215.1 ABC transporter permease [Ectobacillus ponti]